MSTNPSPSPLKKRLVCPLFTAATLCMSFSSAALERAPDEAPSSPVDLAGLPLERLLDLEIASASHFPQTRRQAPAAAQVITRSEIQAHGWRTLGQALATLPGVYTSYDRSYLLLGARGLLHPGDYGSRFLLLVDGQRSNEPVYGQASVGTEAVIDIDMIARIEYVPGPGSAMFGSNAYLGVINVVTLSPADRESKRSSIGIGSAESTDLLLSHSWVDPDGVDVLLAVSSRRTRGRDLYFPDFHDADSDGIARGLDHDRTRRLQLKLSQPGMSVGLHHMQRTKGIPTASFGQTFNAPGAYVSDERTALDFSIIRPLGSDLQLSGTAGIGHHRYTGDYIYDEGPFLVNRDITSATWMVTEWKLLSTAWRGHKLAVGTDMHYDLRLDQQNFDVQPFAMLGEDRRSGYRMALFIDDEVALGSRMQLTAGLRLDHDSELGSRLSPRLALIAHVDEDTLVKAIMGEAFRAPNPYELYYGGEDVGQWPNPELSAETIRTTELVVGRRIGEDTNVSASIFRYRLSGLISHVEDDDGMLVFENLDSATSTGIEVSFDQHWRSGAALRGSWSHANVESSALGDGVWNSPRDMYKLVGKVPLLQQRLLLAVDARHVGARTTRAGALPSYRRIDVAATWRFSMLPVEVRLGIENLFDVDYADPTSVDHLQDYIVQDGRTVMLRLSFRH